MSTKDRSKKGKVLVIGGAGYTGSKIVSKLVALEADVVVFDSFWFGNHMASKENIEIFVGDIRSDPLPLEDVSQVIHLANVANDPGVELAPVLSWEVNALASVSIAEQCVTAGIDKLIYASSGSVYGIREEEQVTEDLIPMPISVYNKTKLVAERVFLSYRDFFDTYIVRPATVCGLSERMRLDVAVNLLTFSALSTGEIRVLGGSQVRPNIHIDDLAEVYCHLLLEDVAPGIYNAGFENMSILELATKIQKRTDAKISVTESNDPRSYRQNSDKLISTGFSPSKSVDLAIDEIIQSFQEGKLEDNNQWHTVATMKNLGMG